MTDSDPESAIKVVKESPNLRELTTQVLRDAILNMHFKPRERLVERRLCEQTGVSRTSVREALRHLESEGLVERIPNRGLYVTAVSPDEARQIYEVRAALESMAGRLFVERAGDDLLEELAAAFGRVEDAARQAPVMAYVRALDAFYEVLLRGAGNDVAQRVLRTLRARMNYLRALTARASDDAHRQASFDRMRKILEAARRRDAKATERACRDFVRGSAAFAAQVLRDQDDPPSGP